MKYKNYLITTYYIVMIAILAFQAVSTVFQFSKNVGYGTKIATLQKKKQELIREKQATQLTLSNKISLVNFEIEEKSSFKPINKTISVLPKTTTASVE